MGMSGTRVQTNKPHKSRFSSKSSIKVRKIPIEKTERYVGKQTRSVRVQRNKMIREQKKAVVLKQKRELSGSTAPPRVIVLFALCASVDLELLADDLLSLLSKDSSTVLLGPVTPTIASSEYRTRISVLKAPHGDLLACMEMVKDADLLVFVASAKSSCEKTASHYIDSFGNKCLSVFRSLGLPSTALFIRDLPTELKQRNELKNICSSSLASEFPEDCKCYPADTKDDLHKFLWLFKEQRLKIPHWRTQRPYVMAHKVDAVCNGIADKCTLVLTGYLRARSLSVNQMVHLSGAGDFPLCKIEVLEDPFPLNSRKNQDLMDLDETHDVKVIRTLVPDPPNPDNQKDIDDKNAGDQTTEAEITKEDEGLKQKEVKKRKLSPTEAKITKTEEDHKQKKARKRKLPAGTSEYQAAWLLMTGRFDCDEDDDGIVVDEKDNEALGLEGDGDNEEKNDNDSMEVDNMTREKIQDELNALKEAHAADEEFPDEVDTPLDVPARERFAKYKGLKSIKNSKWDPKESLPQDYHNFFNYHDFKRAQKHVLAKALELERENREDCIPVGTYARLHIMEVPSAVASKLCMLAKTNPVTACGLLEHENKVSVLHFSVKKHETYDAPIKSKEELIFHVGFRQFVGRPIFSSEVRKSDNNKMERFLHAGCFSVASVCAPISFPPLPTIILKRAGEDAEPEVAAFGSLKTVDRDRVILKRVTLTGYPERVSKNKVAVKHMFYNPEDVKYFRPVEIRTKGSLRGRIKEPVGTHGTMKCLLSGNLEQSDTVCMDLYKRAFPKLPNHLFPLSSALE